MGQIQMIVLLVILALAFAQHPGTGKSHPGLPVTGNKHPSLPSPSEPHPVLPAPSFPAETPKPPQTYPSKPSVLIESAYPGDYSSPDVCSGEPDGKKIPVNGVCYAYNECQKRYAEYHECDIGYRFDTKSEHCVKDSNCVTACPPDWKPDPRNESNYILKDNVQYCPATTKFDYRQCTCVVKKIKNYGR